MKNNDHPKIAPRPHDDADEIVFYPPPGKTPGGPVDQPEPALRVLVLDTSPQASALLMLAVDGDIPTFDLAIYADAPNHRPRIFARPALVQQHAIRAGIPILRVSADGPPDTAIRAKLRQILGFPEPAPVPPGVVADLALPVSLDTVHQATGSTVPYLWHTFPLLELGWALGDCQGYLRSRRMEAPADPRWRRTR